MFQYEKILQYPINIKTPNPLYAKIILTQYGGPDEPLILWHIKLVSTYSRISPYPEKKHMQKSESKTHLSSTLLNLLHFFQLRGMG